ncbi:hypothetical protein NX059_008992 [Plenodomus lindquistii]|nr:hypothetical protein NX059_008992 [Plenodomus lindquistii]
MPRFEVRGRYLDEYKLEALCRILFGQNDRGEDNFDTEFDEASDTWILELPRELSQAELASCAPSDV